MRITEKMLQLLVNQINKTAGTPLTYCDKTSATFKSNINHYHLDMAYGGYKLVQVVNEGGGIHCITQGYISKKELFYQMQAFLSGLQARN